jgi:hypothetical protein
VAVLLNQLDMLSTASHIRPFMQNKKINQPCADRYSARYTLIPVAATDKTQPAIVNMLWGPTKLHAKYVNGDRLLVVLQYRISNGTNSIT